MPIDTYKTIAKPSEEIIFKEKKSKFYGYAHPISDENEVKLIIEELKKVHHSANHVCYAWQLGIDNPRYRANDDGEPNNSAGMPIYGQIQSFDLTQVLVSVVRFFGGTKLGVGGLIAAYRTTAQMALDASQIKECIIFENLKISFGYQELDKVMREIKRHRLKIETQNMTLKCEIIISVRKIDVESTIRLFDELQHVELEKLN